MNTKTLKFAPDLVPLVLSGQKTSTWRLWDDKDLSVGDNLELLNAETKERFGVAQITNVVIKQLGNLTQEDKNGHEVFEDNEKMYEVYTAYYKRQVGPETEVKIIWFKLI